MKSRTRVCKRCGIEKERDEFRKFYDTAYPCMQCEAEINPMVWKYEKGGLIRIKDKWTEDEAEYLKNGIAEMTPISQIAKRLGRTYGSVYRKAKRMGIT